MNRIILFIGTLLLLTGCIGGTSPRTNFYTLDDGMLPSSGLSDSMQSDGLAIGVGPVVLPDMLKRPQIVSRDGKHGIVVSEFHRWIDDLNINIKRVISKQLLENGKANRVFQYPWPAYRHVDYQVRIDISRFDGVVGQSVVLNGTWTLLDGSATRELMIKSFNLNSQTADDSYQAMVVTMSDLTVQLAENIGSGISEYHSGR
jgi:uncharacterized lipoprotein YmbA